MGIEPTGSQQVPEDRAVLPRHRDPADRLPGRARDAGGHRADRRAAPARVPVAEQQRTSPVSAAVHYRNLRVLFGWLEREGERTAANPMARVDEPKAPRKVKQALDSGQLAALLKACSGAGFEERRDTAILRVLIDTGVRVSGAGRDPRRAREPARQNHRGHAEGREQILIPLGKKAAAALDRYLRARARHSHADSEWLWLGIRGTGCGTSGCPGSVTCSPGAGGMQGSTG